MPEYIRLADNAGLSAAGYRLQLHKLVSRPFQLASMVLLAAAFSLRFARMGGVQKMVLGGVLSGFLLYVLSKITEDMSTDRPAVAGDRSVDSGVDWRTDGLPGAALSGRRVMMVRKPRPGMFDRAVSRAVLSCSPPS